MANLFQGLLNFLQFVSMSALTALVLVLLPLAILRKARRPISTAIYVISVLWGVTLWVTATAVLLNHWGTIGFVLGVVLLGFGSLPLAAVASALNAEWATAGILLLLVLPVWGARLLAVWLGSSGQDQGRQRTDRRVTEPRARPAAATPKTERMAERPEPQDQDGRSPSPHMEGRSRGNAREEIDKENVPAAIDPEALLKKGSELESKGQHREAIALLSAAADGLLAVGKVPDAARALGNMGRAYRNCGEREKALELSKRAVGLFRQAGDRLGEAMELLLQANTVGTTDAHAAIAAHKESFVIADELGNEQLVAMNLFRSGVHLIRLSLIKDGRDFLRYAGLLYARCGHREYQAETRKVIQDLIDQGVLPRTELDDALDEFFLTPPRIDEMGALMARYPALCSEELLGVLDSVDKNAVGRRCIGRAIADSTALVRAIRRAVLERG